MTALFRTESGIPYTKVEQVSRIAVESLLTLTVGVLLGRLAWAVLAPADAGMSATELSSTAPASSAPSPAALLSGMEAFEAGPSGLLTDASAGAETALDLKLSGVRAVTGNTAASSAIISFPDGLQKRFVPGDEVMPGVLLVNVTGEAVHLSRSGSLEILSLRPSQSQPFAPPVPPDDLVYAADTTPAASQAEITPAALAADTVLTPELRNGEVAGYRAAPRGGGAFEAAGLQSGDLILRINGEAIEGLRPEQISQSVGSGSDVALDVVRAGAIVQLRVTPGTSLSQ